VRRGHPLTKGRITPARFAGGRHVQVSRTGVARGLLDERLENLGLGREVAAVVGGFAAAIALARETELIANVPERHTGNLRNGMCTFALPVALPEITVSMLWHPRMEADAAHRWLRDCVVDVCAVK
jgi:DNA-binding transcriptional LysR family regulator